jgi:MSHA biogenesis protein MshP
MRRDRDGQSGFTLPATIFILVILASLSAFLVSVSAVSHTASSLALQGARAYYAAYSGLEWATHLATATQTSHDAICGAAPSGITTTFGITTPTGTGLSGGFAITATCVDNNAQYTESGVNYELDQITVTATTSGINVGDPDYATRTLSATVTTGSQLPP